MITRRHLIKLIAFLVVAVVAVVYVAFNYAGLGKFLGSSGYVVTARFDKPGGVFVGSEVTYRGVAVGSVSDMRLTQRGIAVDLTMDEDAPEVPRGTKAAVANRSPIGEQYVDLRPDDTGGPYLSDGDTIPTGRTSVPVSSSTVLLNLNKLVNGIDTDSIRTIVDEADKAFAGTGEDLQQLLDTADSFSSTALEHSPETKQLLSDSRTVLQTQRENDDNLRTIAGGFNTLAAQLKKSDPDLRKIIDEAPELGDEVSKFLDKSGTDMSMLFANLLTTSEITSKRTGSFKTLLTSLPVISAQSTSRAPDGVARLGLTLNLFDPPSCTKGYNADQRPPTDVSEKQPNMDAYCAEPSGSETGVRGAQNAPHPDDSGGIGQGQDGDEDSDQDSDASPDSDAPPDSDTPQDSDKAGDHDTDKDVSLRGKQSSDGGKDDDGLPGVLELSKPGKSGDSVGALLGAGD